MSSTMRAYVQWAEARIRQVVVGEGLHVGLLGVVQGPLTLTFRLRLIQPAPGALRKLLSLGPALQQALQVDGVRVVDGPGGVVIEMPSPVVRTPSGLSLAAHGQGMTVCVGLDAMRQPVRVDLRLHGAVAWVGPSRRGKTQSMKCTLYGLAVHNRDLRYVVLCHSNKRGDWAAFAGSAGCLGIVTAPGEHEAVVRWAAGDLLRGGGPVVIVVDDLLNLLASADLAAPLAEVASLGAGVGVHLLVGTQEAGSKRGTGGAAVENNMTARVLYRNSNAAGAARATGGGSAGLQSLSGAQGDALLVTDGDAVRMATGLADDGDIRQLPQGSGESAPWMGDEAREETREETREDGSGGWPIEKRPLTRLEAAAVRRLYAEGQSLNGLCTLVYGHKDGRALGWIKNAIQAGRRTRRPDDLSPQ